MKSIIATAAGSAWALPREALERDPLKRYPLRSSFAIIIRDHHWPCEDHLPTLLGIDTGGTYTGSGPWRPRLGAPP